MFVFAVIQRNTVRTARLTLGILDKDLANIVYFVEAGSPALLRLLSPLGVAGVPPHELVIIQGSISRALGIAPPAETAMSFLHTIC